MGFPIPDTGSVTEDTGVVGGLITTAGDAGIFIVGGGSDTGLWTPDTLAGAYGSQLSIDADGVWTYYANNSDPAIQALNTGDTLTEVFTVVSTYGSTTITITINGLDEPPCFVRGTRIETPNGARKVEDLRAGDQVLTSDHGPQRIVWIGSKTVSAGQVPEFEKLQPICINTNAFGPGVPSRPLFVSPLHRILLKGPQAQLLFGQSEVLCSAKMLVNGSNIHQVEAGEVEYFHILFERHHLITAEGCESESFLAGRQGLSSFDGSAQEEVFRLFPELRSLPESYGPAARRVLKRHEAIVFSRLCQPAPDRRCA